MTPEVLRSVVAFIPMFFFGFFIVPVMKILRQHMRGPLWACKIVQFIIGAALLYSGYYVAVNIGHAINSYTGIIGAVVLLAGALAGDSFRRR